ncbi:response regulator transcription factor [Thalassobacillus sp. C254]|uniref:response regulator transcription factor n=1 Tax=Thalassobacillus sp. C254 TaxID=1225341 RepID=UPI0006D22351|nr:LuxR C-terminal-related transcriptional regulator [Thalassobacillus sp. C254]
MVLSTSNINWIRNLLKENINHIYSNEYLASSFYSLYHRSVTFHAYVDPCFQNYLLQIIRKPESFPLVSEKHDVLDDDIYLLKIQEKELGKVLTNAQSIIFRELLEGKSNKQIANDVFLALPTVNAHVSRILKILSARNKCHLYKRALEKRIIVKTLK